MAVVDEINHQPLRRHPRRDQQLRVIRSAVFAGVGDEVDKDLHQPVEIAGQHDILGLRITQHFERPRGPRLRRGHRQIQQIAQVAFALVQRHLPVFQNRQIQQIVEQPRQTDRLAMDDRGIAVLVGVRETGRIAQDFGERADRGHRRAQFMADLTEEAVLLQRQLRQLLIRRAQLRCRLGQLPRLGLQLAGILQHLRGFVGHGQKVLDRDRGSADDLRHHRMGRGRPDRGRQLPLQRLHESWRGLGQTLPLPLPFCLAGEKRLRLRRAQDALRHDHQVFAARDRGRPPPRRAGMVKNINELRAL